MVKNQRTLQLTLDDNKNYKCLEAEENRGEAMIEKASIISIYLGRKHVLLTCSWLCIAAGGQTKLK